MDESTPASRGASILHVTERDLLEAKEVAARFTLEDTKRVNTAHPVLLGSKIV
jgi:hypothetical protein